MYRQYYCGCVFSKRQRDAEIAARAAAEAAEPAVPEAAELAEAAGKERLQEKRK